MDYHGEDQRASHRNAENGTCIWHVNEHRAQELTESCAAVRLVSQDVDCIEIDYVSNSLTPDFEVIKRGSTRGTYHTSINLGNQRLSESPCSDSELGTVGTSPVAPECGCSESASDNGNEDNAGRSTAVTSPSDPSQNKPTSPNHRQKGYQRFKSESSLPPANIRVYDIHGKEVPCSDLEDATYFDFLSEMGSTASSPDSAPEVPLCARSGDRPKLCRQ